MTREEIVESLNILKEQAQKSHNDTAILNVKVESFVWVIESAIQALSQEPCDDAISREAVMRLIENKPYDWSNLTERHNMLMEIRKLPSVTQKYGKWIEHPEIETSAPEYLMFYECSECGDKQCFCKSDIHKKRFCNNCGAKMVEPQESEDKE